MTASTALTVCSLYLYVTVRARRHKHQCCTSARACGKWAYKQLPSVIVAYIMKWNNLVTTYNEFLWIMTLLNIHITNIRWPRFAKRVKRKLRGGEEGGGFREQLPGTWWYYSRCRSIETLCADVFSERWVNVYGHWCRWYIVISSLRGRIAVAFWEAIYLSLTLRL